MVLQTQNDEQLEKKGNDCGERELREKEAISEAIENAMLLIQGLKNSTN